MTLSISLKVFLWVTCVTLLSICSCSSCPPPFRICLSVSCWKWALPSHKASGTSVTTCINGSNLSLLQTDTQFCICWVQTQKHSLGLNMIDWTKNLIDLNLNSVEPYKNDLVWLGIKMIWFDWLTNQPRPKIHGWLAISQSSYFHFISQVIFISSAVFEKWLVF